MVATSNPFNEPNRTSQYGAMQHWYSALANRDYANAKILGIGDSIMQGYYSTNFSTRSWWNRLMARLRAEYQPGGTSVGGSGYYWQDTFDSILPWTLVGSAGTSNSFGFPQGCISVPADGGTSYATLTVTGTSADIYYLQYASGQGVINVSVDGGAAQTQAATGTNLDGRHYRVSLGAAGSHTIKVTATTNGVIITGALIYNGDENYGFSHMNGARNAWAMQDYFTYNSGLIGKPAYRAYANGYQPDLVLMAVGINDWLNKGRTAAQFGADLQTMVTALNAEITVPPTIVFIVQYEGGSITQKNVAAPRVWPDFVAQYYAVAAANSNVAVCDMSRRIKPPLVTNVDGLGYTDLLHLSDKGHAYYADVVFEFLRYT